MENSTTETIGCDLGDRMSDVCVMDAAGRTRRARVPSTRKGMTAFFAREPAHVVIEAGAHRRPFPRGSGSLCHSGYINRRPISTWHASHVMSRRRRLQPPTPGAAPQSARAESDARA
jgi:hypothetical protein